ncbi:MAG: exosortase-associated EpsI family protein [Planctomycetota bacterium]
MLSVAVLAAAGFAGGFSSRPVPGIDLYFARVADEIAAIPYKIGPWVGEDAPVQPSAVELLAPNKMLSRSYLNTETGERATLLIVHCGDVRDMVGHDPPVCYPANGWKPVGQREGAIDSVETGVPGVAAVPVTRFGFDRLEAGVTIEREVVRFFALPSEELPLTSDRGQLGRTSRSSARSGLGAAQLQLLFPRRMPESERRAAERLFARALSPVLATVASGTAGSGVVNDG